MASRLFLFEPPRGRGPTWCGNAGLPAGELADWKVGGTRRFMGELTPKAGLPCDQEKG